jgi:hypothetical protein
MSSCMYMSLHMYMLPCMYMVRCMYMSQGMYMRAARAGRRGQEFCTVTNEADPVFW